MTLTVAFTEKAQHLSIQRTCSLTFKILHLFPCRTADVEQKSCQKQKATHELDLGHLYDVDLDDALSSWQSSSFCDSRNICAVAYIAAAVSLLPNLAFISTNEKL